MDKVPINEDPRRLCGSDSGSKGTTEPFSGTILSNALPLQRRLPSCGRVSVETNINQLKVTKVDARRSQTTPLKIRALSAKTPRLLTTRTRANVSTPEEGQRLQHQGLWVMWAWLHLSGPSCLLFEINVLHVLLKANC